MTSTPQIVVRDAVLTPSGEVHLTPEEAAAVTAQVLAAAADALDADGQAHDLMSRRTITAWLRGRAR